MSRYAKMLVPVALTLAAASALSACGHTEKTVVATPGSTVVVHGGGDTRVVTP